MRKKTFLNSQNCTALPDIGNTYCISISLTIISSAKFQFEPQIVTNIMQNSSILGIKPVGPYERILRLRHSFILSFFHVRSHSNEGIFGSFSGSPTSLWYLLAVSEWVHIGYGTWGTIHAFSKLKMKLSLYLICYGLVNTYGAITSQNTKFTVSIRWKWAQFDFTVLSLHFLLRRR